METCEEEIGRASRKGHQSLVSHYANWYLQNCPRTYCAPRLPDLSRLSSSGSYQRHEVVPLVRPEDGECLPVLVRVPQSTRLDDGSDGREINAGVKMSLWV